MNTDIIGFNGKPRQGKTLGLAILGRHYKRLGIKIYSNFTFEGAQFITPYDFVKWLKLGAEYAGYSPLFQSVVLAQEFQTWIESRLGKKKAELLITDFICQAPKLGIKLCYDAQLNSSVDKRLKQNCSQRMECQRYPNDDKNWRFIRYWDLDIEYTEENVRTGKKRSINRPWIEKHILRLGTGQPPIYNTRKVSLRPDFNDTVMDLERQDPKLMLETIEQQANLLLKNRHLWMDTAVISVKYALLKLHQPLAFADFVAAALKVQVGTRR